MLHLAALVKFLIELNDVGQTGDLCTSFCLLIFLFSDRAFIFVSFLFAFAASIIKVVAKDI